MNHQKRVLSLKPARQNDLDAYVSARFNASCAARKISRAIEKEVKTDTFNSRVNRLAERFGFPCLTDLVVWYELEYKGSQNARDWKAQLAPRFGAVTDHPQAVENLRILLDLTRKKTKGRLARIAAESQVCERTITRQLEEFAKEADITYSLNWLIFLCAIHETLCARPELLRE